MGLSLDPSVSAVDRRGVADRFCGIADLKKRKTGNNFSLLLRKVKLVHLVKKACTCSLALLLTSTRSREQKKQHEI
jgi:hypothetical protein